MRDSTYSNGYNIRRHNWLLLITNSRKTNIWSYPYSKKDKELNKIQRVAKSRMIHEVLV